MPNNSECGLGKQCSIITRKLKKLPVNKLPVLMCILDYHSYPKFFKANQNKKMLTKPG